MERQRHNERYLWRPWEWSLSLRWWTQETNTIRSTYQCIASVTITILFLLLVFHILTISLQLPPLPSNDRLSYLMKYYWNCGVKTTFNFLVNLPTHTSNAAVKTYEFISSSLDGAEQITNQSQEKWNNLIRLHILFAAHYFKISFFWTSWFPNFNALIIITNVGIYT